MSENRKKALIVTGMHRSGTSALMRVCNLLGAEVGEDLVAPLPDNNETGFWEHAELVERNEAILEHFQTTHLGVLDLPDDWLRDDEVDMQREKIIGIIRRDLLKRSFWGVKDPRISRLMPIWKHAYEVCDLQPLVIISLRNPLEVAMSLEKRNNISREQALLLWVKYNLELERDTRDMKRSYIAYPSLLSDWRGAIDKATKQLGLQWPVAVEDAATEIDGFLRSDLHHNKIDDLAKEDVPEMVIKLFTALSKGADGGQVDQAACDEVAKEIAVFSGAYADDVNHMRYALQHQTKDVVDLQTHIDVLHKSTSWRITLPLRLLMKTISLGRR